MRIGSRIGDRWRLIELAGRGASGVVFKAEDTARDGAHVAVKILGALDGRERFAREVRVLAALEHPHIVRYLDHGEHEHAPYLVTEWLAGESLKARLERARLDPEDALALARAVASALASVHAQGVVHRDIKPSNLFLPDGVVGAVKVLDFGVARVADGVDLTHAGAAVGTPSYMSPEQVRGAPLDARSDLFALGVVLFEALTGENPFAASDVVAVLSRLLLEDTPRLAGVDVPRWLDELVTRLLAREPSLRPESAARLVAELTSHPREVTDQSPARELAPISLEERRVMSVVLVRDHATPLMGSATMSLAPPSGPDEISALDELASRHGGRVQRLPGGDMLIVFGQTGTAADRASHAVRCALELARAGRWVAVATGHGLVTSALTIGDVVARVRTLPRPPCGAVALDDTSERLLDARFSIAGDLIRYCLAFESARTVTRPGLDAPFVGRAGQLAALHMLVDEAFDAATARCVLVSGEPGAGKSRLVHELVRAITVPSGERVTVWNGRADATRRAVPLGLIADLLVSALGLGRERDLMPLLRARLTALFGASDPDAERTVHDMVAPPRRDVGELAADATGLARRRDAVLQRVVRAAAKASRLIVVLEDLHWCDASSRAALTELIALEDAPIVWLATTRPEGRDALVATWREHVHLSLALSPLSADTSEQLVRSLCPDASPELRGAIAAKAGGNPFYLEELARAARHGASSLDSDTVRMMLQTQLESLHPIARRILRAGSVLGRRFSVEAVSDIADLPRASVLEHLGALARERLVRTEAEPTYRDTSELSFRHDLIREAAYMMSTEADRRRAHRLAASFLERVGETSAAVLADHLTRGGRLAEAGPRWVLAAEQAFARGDSDGAMSCCTEARRAEVGGVDLGRVLLTESWGTLVVGDPARSATLASAALDLLAPGSDDWFRAAGIVGSAGVYGGKSDVAHALVGRIDALWPAEPTPLVLQSSGRLVSSLVTVGAREAALPLIARFAALDETTVRGNPGGAWIDQVRAFLDVDRGDHSAAAVRFLDISTRLYALGYPWLAAAQRANGIDEYLKVGAWALAEEATRWVDEVVLPGRLRLMLARYAALARAYLGDLDASRAMLAGALVVWDVALTNGQAEVHLAGLTMRAGQLDAAREHAERALRLLEPYPHHRVCAFAMRSRIAHRMGDAALGAADALAARAALAELGSRTRRQPLIRLALIEATLATGHVESARAQLADAVTALRDAATRISDPTLAASFLEAVPEHRDTLALVDVVAR